MTESIIAKILKGIPPGLCILHMRKAAGIKADGLSR